MPESPEELYARIGAVRLPAVETTTLRAPVDVDPPRVGVEDCPICASLTTERTIWQDERFFVSRMFEPCGLSIYFLQTTEHLDYTEMDDELAGECGRLQVILCRILERLDHVGRVMVCRFQIGAEHMHVWFVVQPARMPQLRGWSALAWADVLPPIPDETVRRDAAEVARELATHGGRAMG